MTSININQLSFPMRKPNGINPDNFSTDLLLTFMLHPSNWHEYPLITFEMPQNVVFWYEFGTEIDVR